MRNGRPGIQHLQSVFAEAYSAVFHPGERPENAVIYHLLEAGEGPVNPVQTEAPDPLSNAAHILDIAEWLEADTAGIAELERDFIAPGATTDAESGAHPRSTEHRYGIFLVKTLARRRRRSHNLVTRNQHEELLHTELALIACMLADYIRELGFSATAHYGSNAHVLHEPISRAARAAGPDRNRKLFSQNQRRVCLATVTTDMPLAAGVPFRRHSRRPFLPDFLRTVR